MNKLQLDLYRSLLVDIKSRVRHAQRRAALSANAEMLLMYWDIGRMIAERQKAEGWGAGVIPRLAVDLKNELPEEKGFSERNLKRMIQFWSAYPALFTIGPRPVAQLAEGAQTDSFGPPSVAQSPAAGGDLTDPGAALPSLVVSLSWAHNVILLQSLKEIPLRCWYAQQALEQGWSRDTLTQQIKSRVHERQGAAVTNFVRTLAEPHAAIAQQLLKDPYIFDFLTLEEPFHERELETGLLRHLQRFMLELGRGFAFVGRQHKLEVSGREFYLDLLFYHLGLRCFIVVDLKKGEFQPEHAGKMSFYCSAVDDLLRHEGDGPTIGLILCQTKDRVIAEYALRGVHKPIGLAEYELTRALPENLASVLPSIEDLEAELAEELGSDTERPTNTSPNP
jgi:predicted nuclease of restriction endonuclease-like (RecB) superfamily